MVEKKQTYGKENRFSEPKSKTEKEYFYDISMRKAPLQVALRLNLSLLWAYSLLDYVQKFSDEGPFNAPHGNLRPSMKLKLK